ncbi:hypothetical protein J2129_000851 [Methanofollis sp. W23]|uniref:hypothetical protein n=1 Tax=Methanofollis sp. W23 TaxID=2817849 RepID=UPI001AE42DA1|nr:hypothetical protein [Methanofollis sp. W23]MBP2145397.1 hypothetical protein [Methanofollis sp. W23]
MCREFRKAWRHVLDLIVPGKKVPGFEEVNSTLEDAMTRGVLPQGFVRDLEVEWDLYCRVTKMLRRWPACTPAEFVEHLALAEGKVPPEDHPAWSARVSVIVQAFLEHDRTLFLQEGEADGMPVPFESTDPRHHIAFFLSQMAPRHRRKIPLKRFPGSSEEKEWRHLWESDEIDEIFPQLKEVYHYVLPQKRDPSGLNRRQSAVIVRGVYWAVQGYYTKTQTIPPFSVVGARLGTGVGTRHFPMALYTWVAIRDLHREIECQMAAVHEGKDDATPATHLQQENDG